MALVEIFWKTLKVLGKVYARAAFPYVLGGISAKCKVFNHRKVGQFYHNIFSMVELKEASEKGDRYIMNQFRKHFKKGIKVWEYDLATKQWIFKAQHERAHTEEANRFRLKYGDLPKTFPKNGRGKRRESSNI